MSLSPRAIVVLVAALGFAAWWYTRPAEGEGNPPGPAEEAATDAPTEPRSSAGEQVEAMRAAAQGSVDQHADRMADAEAAADE